VSELFGNSVRHSRSGAAGETVTVAVRAGEGLVRVEVTDRKALRCRSFTVLVGMRKAVAGFRWLRAWRRGGDGGGVAGR